MTFPEFDGAQIHSKFHNGWGSICKYLTKQDNEPLVWGEFYLEKRKETAEASRNHKNTNLVPQEQIIERIKKCYDWYQVYNDEVLTKLTLHSYSNLRNVYEDLKVVHDMRTTIGEIFFSSMEKHGQPKEYEIEELQEKYLLLDWIACQICFQRPIKTKQLFIYGKPCTQKTLFFHLLTKVL